MTGDRPEPKEGDLNICIDCGGVAVHEGQMLRKPSEDEQRVIDSNYQVQHILAALRFKGTL